ncbi:hypothetical protein [Chloroflexus sp.]|uniref:hypothetical protein n=1 Tax=Chloroflexus sp. TaxID=1904827 RepID=UPI00404A386A
MTALVKRIQQEVQQDECANEQKLIRRLRALAAMAEDIFAVTVSMLTDPQTTVATVARRAATKVQQEQ